MNTPAKWKPISTTQVAGVFLGMVSLILFYATSEETFVPVLDHANLMFHEAGHPIFQVFGDTIGFLGGTLGQLFFPTVVTVSFWVKKDPLGYCIGMAWFSQNLVNIARYMADARTQLLPLLGGGLHDWTHLFSQWGVLHLDRTIAGLVEGIGFSGLVGSGLWLAWMWWFENEPANGTE